MGMPVCLARRALHAAVTDPDQTLQVLAAGQGAELFDTLLARTVVRTTQGWQTLHDPEVSDPLTLRGLIALAPPNSARAATLREQLTDLLIEGHKTKHTTGVLRYLDRLPRLRRLRVAGCAALVGWDALAGHPALSFLELDRCGATPSELALLARTRLQTIHILGRHPRAPALHRLPVLQELSSLSVLTLADLPALEALPGLDRVPLRQLRLEGLPGLSALPALPETLETLQAPAVPMAALPEGLRSLSLDDLAEADLDHLPLPEALTHLTLVRASALVRLPVLSSLESASLAGCAALASLAPLSASPGLRWLDLRGCASVSDLAPLEGMPALVAIAIEGSGVRRKKLPAALKRRAVSGWSVDLAARARRVQRPRSRSSLSSTLLSALRQIRGLLQSGDTPQLQQALELVFALDEPELYGALLRGCGVSVLVGDRLPELRLGGNLTPKGGPREAARLRWAALRLLASAPADLSACAFRHSTTALRLESPVVNLADLVAVFPNLERLQLVRTKTWRHPDALGNLSSLHELVLENCVPPAGLHYPRSLRRLETSGDRHLTDLSPLAALDTLDELRLLQVDALASLDGLPPSVQILSVSRARSLRDLSALTRCAGLRVLALSACPALDALDGLGDHRQLQRLSIDGCRGVRSLAPLRGCDALEKVALGDLALVDLCGLEDATGLYDVSLRLEGLRELDALAGADLLRLELGGCVSLAGLAGLAGSRSMRTLSLRQLSITDCGDLVGMTGLEELRVDACAALEDVSGLGALPSLRVVELWDCGALPTLSGLPPLERLELRGVAADLSALSAIGELRCRGAVDAARLAGLPAEQVGALVLWRDEADAASVPDDIADKVCWRL